MPGVEMSAALGNVRGYEFGDCEVVYYCFMNSSGEVRRKGGVF